MERRIPARAQSVHVARLASAACVSYLLRRHEGGRAWLWLGFGSGLGFELELGLWLGLGSALICGLRLG